MTASISEQIASTTASARGRPTDASLRMQLFRLMIVTGQWERAVTQLDTASTLDSSLGFTVTVYKQAIACEKFRAEVFAGRRTPVIAGEPSAWVAQMIEALRGGESESAAQLRAAALDAAPASAGNVDGRAFQWIADADSRLGPQLEAFIDGKYYWVPFERIGELRITEPTDTLDTVWASAELTVSNGGTKHVLLPVRYAQTELRDDDALRRAALTIWEGDDVKGFRGIGQRMLVTDAEEIGLLDVRRISFG